MAIVVLGEHHRERPQQALKPPWRPPSELGGMAPPDVKLTKREPRHDPRPRKAPQERSDDEVGHRSEEAVEQHRRIAGDHGMIEVWATAVVVCAQVQRKPKMLWDVIEER